MSVIMQKPPSGGPPFAAALQLPPSIAQVLWHRGIRTEQEATAFLSPALEQLGSPHAFPQMTRAVDRLLKAVRAEEPIAIYADRDVDGLTGLAILARTLRSVGGQVIWGSPVKGRGLERPVLERLIQTSRAKILVLVDCGTAEHTELAWLAGQGMDVIIADHHRLTGERPPALAWIHPGVMDTEDGQAPAGCVMAFKLAQAIWLSFLGPDDRERLDYFLFSHLDLVAMGVLADRVSLTGENRILVWHGLRRLACSRKVGVAALTRFFRLTPRSEPLTVREVTWQLIPILNAGGRLGHPELTAELLMTEDPDAAYECIDRLLALNTRRREAQDKSLIYFEKAVLEQCAVDSDPVLIALADGLEPSVTGLAAQALVRKYGRPTFLFVRQGAETVGSGRGTAGVDLFQWVETHQHWLVKYGGHQGAVGLTVRTEDFAAFRGHLLKTAHAAFAANHTVLSLGRALEVSPEIEAEVSLPELDAYWWISYERLGPFGQGHPQPLFKLTGVDAIAPVTRRKSKRPAQEIVLKGDTSERRAQLDDEQLTARARDIISQIQKDAVPGPWVVVGYPSAARRSEKTFKWVMVDLWRRHG